MKEELKTVAEPPPSSAGALPRASSDLREGQVFGGFEIIRLLGRGGMGAVYLAKQTKLDRLVVVKVIAAELAAQPEIVGRLHREARAAAKVASDHAVQVFECDTVDGVPFIAMEYVEGCSVDEHLEKKYRLSPPEATRIVIEALRGLKAAHDVGVLHRDMKPANLLMTKDGRVKVADFGLAKLGSPKGTDVSQPKSATLSIEGQILGTPAYMAPEQADAKPLDARADIYALGVTYYQLLTGELPFKGSTPLKLIASMLNDPVTPPRSIIPSIPEPVDRACLALMARDPYDRPPSAAAAIQLLESLGTATTASSVSSSMVSGVAAPVSTHAPQPSGPPAPKPLGRPSSPRVLVGGLAPESKQEKDRTLLVVAGGSLIALVVAAALVSALVKPVVAPAPKHDDTPAVEIPSDPSQLDPPIFSKDPEEVRREEARAKELEAIEKASLERRQREEDKAREDSAKRAAKLAEDKRSREDTLQAREQMLEKQESDLKARAAELRREADQLAKRKDPKDMSRAAQVYNELQRIRQALDQNAAQQKQLAKQRELERKK